MDPLQHPEKLDMTECIDSAGTPFLHCRDHANGIALLLLQPLELLVVVMLLLLLLLLMPYVVSISARSPCDPSWRINAAT
jgi:hypothetical protein